MNPIIHKDNVNVNTHALTDLPIHMQLRCNEIHKHLGVFKDFIVRWIIIKLMWPIVHFFVAHLFILRFDGRGPTSIMSNHPSLAADAEHTPVLNNQHMVTG